MTDPAAETSPAAAGTTGELRSAAAKAGKRLGTAVNLTALNAEPLYAQILGEQFDSVTPENALKWGPLTPEQGVYDWAAADAIVEFAEAHAQVVKGHTLVWHEQLPSWLPSAVSADGDGAQLSALLQQHIKDTVTRYRGRVYAWDVVNEAVNIDTASGYTESVFWQKLGPDYIEQAFRWAREADPDALLLYNEVGIERLGPKSDFTYALMQQLLAKGTPIDGIGFQSHVSIHRYPSEANLRANIRRFSELGLRVNISELDARTTLLPGDAAQRWEAQRIAYQQVVGACVVEPGCEGVTLWGFTDKYSWINDDGPDDPLPFDRNYQPKPAYLGVLQGLAGELPTPGENLISNGDFSAGLGAWTASAGALALATAGDRPGWQACVSGRTAELDALVSGPVLDALAAGGPHALSAWVRLNGASSGVVEATLNVTELVDGAESHAALSLGAMAASDVAWVELTGYFGLGFAGTPTAISLEFSGPPAGVDLCVMDVNVARVGG